MHGIYIGVHCGTGGRGKGGGMYQIEQLSNSNKWRVNKIWFMAP